MAKLTKTSAILEGYATVLETARLLAERSGEQPHVFLGDLLAYSVAMERARVVLTGEDRESVEVRSDAAAVAIDALFDRIMQHIEQEIAT